MTRRLACTLVVACAACLSGSLDGAWRSIGYGNAYRIRGPLLEAFEVTSATCVASYTAKRVAQPAGVVRFRKSRGKDVMDIEPGPDGDHLLLSHPGGLSKVRIVREAGVPATCRQLTPDTPGGNFDVFARNLAEHYNAFDARGVDWGAVTAAHREKTSASTTPAELFAIFDSMLAPLGDLHNFIGASRIHRESKAYFRAGTDRVMAGDVDRFAKSGRPALFAITEKAYPLESKRVFCNRQIEYGMVQGGIGYLRFLSFGDWSKRGKDREAIDLALDRILADRSLRALILDLRLSFGGDDALGLAIASRLTRERYLAYSIQARADAVDREKWSEPDHVFVEPSRRAVFTGPVVVLTGPVTMSAAETFVQALMGRTPRVTRIGESTQGVFCDPLGRRLPNGWSFGFPNAVYRTVGGEAFDARGIPPDIAAPVFDEASVAAGRDPAMDAAVALLH